MKSKKRFAKTFYTKRHLPTPRVEYWPENAGELRDAFREPTDAPLLLVGDGQHLRPSVIGERSFDVVRTENIADVISVDRESKLIRVECGIRWQTLQSAAEERGLSMERTRLYPSTSTIGGLLARHDACHKELWDGDLRGYMVALTSVSPGQRDYQYLAAPRKASGPDFRWLYAGSEGLVGAIVDASFVAWKPSDARLWRFEDVDAERMLEIWRQLLDAGMRVSWAHWDGTLSVSAHGLARILKVCDSLVESLGGRADGGAEEVRQVRAELEANHPERRECPSATRTVKITTSLQHLSVVCEEVRPEAESLQILDLTRHRGSVFVTYPKGHVGAELPSAIANMVLDAHVVANDEAVHWPHWAQHLKHELDPKRILAMGP